jgi:hypothetical protein
MIKKLTKNLAKQEIGIQFDESAMNLLADLGYEPQFGARPMTRVIQKEIIKGAFHFFALCSISYQVSFVRRSFQLRCNIDRHLA